MYVGYFNRKDISVSPEDNKEDLGLTKKGTPRKRKPKQSRNYFNQETEDAIIQYIKTTDDVKRNKIYNDKIAYSFYKLAENIIHTFKFYYTDSNTIEELKHEVVTFVLTKLDKYDQSLGKAYSYFGTIIKRYLIIYNEKNYKKIQSNVLIDNNPENEDDNNNINSNLIYNEEEEDINISDFLDKYINYMDKNVDSLFPKDVDNKVAKAIIEILDKRENIEIFNKKAIYIYIREMTKVETIHITKVTKKMKEIYIELFNKYYKYGDI